MSDTPGDCRKSKSDNGHIHLTENMSHGRAMPCMGRVWVEWIAKYSAVKLTFAVITKVNELVAPLCKNTQAILEEGDHNQETANSGQIPGVNDTLSAAVKNPETAPRYASNSVKLETNKQT